MAQKTVGRPPDPPGRPSRKSLVYRLFPIAEQLAAYRSEWLPADILAGLSVAAVALPTAIAYPAIAGLPPQAGLYAAILPSVGYALFGPSRQLMVGPDTATTVMLGSALLALGILDPEQRVAAAAAFALAVGLCCVVAGIIGLGLIANFLSRPVLMGFLCGVALDLLIGQLDRLTAVPVESSGLVRPLLEFASKLDRLQPTTLLVGLGIFMVLRLLRRYAPRFPAPLLAIAMGILLAYAFDLQSRGVHLVGAIPSALPVLALPLPGKIAIDDFALGTLGILLVSFGSGIVTARSFGAKNRYHVDANRELIGFGSANIASGLFGGFPVSSSDSRTAVNDAVGGRSQLAGLVAAAGLMGTMLFLGELLAYLPVAALGAVIASAAIDLIDLRGFMSLWRLSRIELAIALIALFGVLRLGILTGVVVAIGATMAHLLWQASNPRDALLGQIPGRDGLYKLHRHPDGNLPAAERPAVLQCRVRHPARAQKRAPPARFRGMADPGCQRHEPYRYDGGGRAGGRPGGTGSARHRLRDRRPSQGSARHHRTLGSGPSHRSRHAIRIGRRGRRGFRGQAHLNRPAVGRSGAPASGTLIAER